MQTLTFTMINKSHETEDNDLSNQL